MSGQQPIKIFYCYAHEDKDLQKRLASHLEPLKKSGKIMTWCDREIPLGTHWQKEIEMHLDSSDIVLVLVSPALMASQYCYNVEMQRALDRQLIGDIRVIPIILREVAWQQTPLGNLQALPTQGKPITSWHLKDQGFLDIAQGIANVVEEIQHFKQMQNPEISRKYERIGFHQLASSQFEKDVNEWAQESFKQAIRYDPKNFEAWRGMVITHIRLQEYEAALPICERLLRGSLSDLNRWRVLCKKMDVLTGLSRTEEAQQVNMEAVEFLLHMEVTESASLLNREEVSEVLRWIFSDTETSKLFKALSSNFKKAALRQKKEGEL